ncbi:LAQU0S21e00584g1_1 [Lachancea quebecensis]|uniref:LAQU0S21e00584g1_1 n=1 Tax=Lachancea quebecensis TaxID=1654605 RepID=A0A0P1KXH4_9SACH|nr:LAQU0S21e00584g1_1 [Lachancea quebecensis]
MDHPKGQLVDDQTRCIHWNSPLDVVCFKFECCEAFYACYSCHESQESHAIKRYNLTLEPAEKVVLCGVCKETMTFEEYRNGKTCGDELGCPYCGAQFNPGCKLHYSIYFDM